MGLGEWWKRHRAHRKLRRGQCLNCHKPLPDDATDQFCSDACGDRYQETVAW